MLCRWILNSQGKYMRESNRTTLSQRKNKYDGESNTEAQN